MNYLGVHTTVSDLGEQNIATQYDFQWVPHSNGFELNEATVCN